MLGQHIPGARRFYFVNMSIGLFDRAILLDQISGCLFTDSRDAGNIIRRITHQGFYVDKLYRRDMVEILHLLRMIDLIYSCTFSGFRNADRGVFIS